MLLSQLVIKLLGLIVYILLVLDHMLKLVMLFLYILLVP